MTLFYAWLEPLIDVINQFVKVMIVFHTWSCSGQLKAFFSLILNSICIVLFALFSRAFASLDFKEKLN